MVLSIVRLVYSLLFMLVLPIIFCRLIYKGRRLPAYRARWAERLGLVSFIADKKAFNPIWVHAASVGEVLAAVPLIKSLKSHHANTPILITTMTPTGSEQVQIHFKNELNNTVFHSYVPYDIDWIVRRFFNRLKPLALVIMETELWPNLLSIAHEKQIPIVIANARLTPKSVKSYQRIKGFMKLILNQVDVVAAQSQLDVERYASLGLDPKKIMYTGNIKYDLTIPEGLFEKAHALKELWGKERPVWIAASTHAGEESKILSVFLELQKKTPDLLLLLVPRHPNRFEEVYQLCLKSNLRILRATQPQQRMDAHVFLGDTMGDLWTYYSASDMVFLGGSLVPIGGHNFLEPASLGLPIVSGPYLANCAEVVDFLKAAGGIKVVDTEKDLQAQLQDFLDHPEQAKAQGQAAQEAAERNRGALNRLVSVIESYLSKK